MFRILNSIISWTQWVQCILEIVLKFVKVQFTDLIFSPLSTFEPISHSLLLSDDFCKEWLCCLGPVLDIQDAFPLVDHGGISGE